MKDISPNPGPCNNRRLIYWNEERHEYMIKEGMVAASASFRGDYRPIAEEAWEIFKTNYPGSGPTISFEYAVKESEDKSKTLLPSNWLIVDPPAPPKPKPKTVLGNISIDSVNDFILSLASPKPSVEKAISPVVKREVDTQSLLASEDSESSRKLFITRSLNLSDINFFVR